jgi:hypothetical protein
MNLFSPKGIQASVHRILKEKYDDRKKLSPNVPPSGGLAYQQTVEQVLAHTQSQASGLDRAEAQARLQKQGRTRCRRKRQTRLAAFPGPF